MGGAASLRILIVMDTYLPARLSAGEQMHALALGMAREGHRPLVLVPAPGLECPWKIERLEGIEILRVRAPRTKGIALWRRALAELLLPFFLLRGFSASPFRGEGWDGLVWYSPTIFLGPLVRRLKSRFGVRSYLVLRDLFPDWAVDTGLLRRGPVYYFFKMVERRQYRAADVIGVESAGNVARVKATLGERGDTRIEILENWRDPPPCAEDPPGPLPVPLPQGCRIFVHAGNLGAAQGISSLIELARIFRDVPEAAFLLIGRGSEQPRVRHVVETEGLTNVLVMDEVGARELATILAQASVGIVSLDPRNSAHNVPGKFLTYLCFGLPVLALVNPSGDLAGLIRETSVGIVVSGPGRDALRESLQRFLEMPADELEAMGRRARRLAEERYTTSVAVRKILEGLKGEKRAPGDGHGKRRTL